MRRERRAYTVLGTPFVVEASTAEVARRIDPLFAPFRNDAGDAGDRATLEITEDKLRRDGQVVLRATDWQVLAGALVRELTGLALDAFGGYAVHAGVVANGGGALAYPGASGQGKSTLTAALLAAGLDYVSDEVLAVDFGSGTVVPHPMPLILSGAGGGERPVPPAELGASVATGPVELADIVLFERRPGPARVDRCRPTEAVTALLRSSFNHYREPQRTFDLVIHLALRCGTWRLGYEDAGEAAIALRERVGR